MADVEFRGRAAHRHRRADGGAGGVLTARYFVTSFRCHRNRSTPAPVRPPEAGPSAGGDRPAAQGGRGQGRTRRDPQEAGRRADQGQAGERPAARATGCQVCASVVGRDRAPAPASQGAAGGDCRQAQARQACTATARLLDVLSIHRGTPYLRQADGPLRLRQGEEERRRERRHARRRPRRHARRREADVTASSAAPPRPRSWPPCRSRPIRCTSPSAARSSAACCPSPDRCRPVRCPEAVAGDRDRTARVDHHEMKRPLESATIDKVGDHLGEALLVVRGHWGLIGAAHRCPQDG